MSQMKEKGNSLVIDCLRTCFPVQRTWVFCLFVCLFLENFIYLFIFETIQLNKALIELLLFFYNIVVVFVIH